MLVLARFPETAPDLASLVGDLFAALPARPGFVQGRLVRSTDVGGGWVLELEWATVGDWRRAFSPYDLRLLATRLFALGSDEPSSYEVLLSVDVAGTVSSRESDRAAPRSSRAR